MTGLCLITFTDHDAQTHEPMWLLCSMVSEDDQLSPVRQREQEFKICTLGLKQFLAGGCTLTMVIQVCQYPGLLQVEQEPHAWQVCCP
jgi:hypothetical protein